jgi:hypothetical protein
MGRGDRKGGKMPWAMWGRKEPLSLKPSLTRDQGEDLAQHRKQSPKFQLRSPKDPDSNLGSTTENLGKETDIPRLSFLLCKMAQHLYLRLRPEMI